MNINKAHWVTEGDNVRLSMPIGKIDKERRVVSGFATLDNVDKQGDVVDTGASLTAFKNFRGNLREMHQPSAVGKVVSFKEDKYFDPQTKKFYSGVYVSAYVSKGAQDAWEKVLDGTYSGFSIGGNIKKFDDLYNEGMDKAVRMIKEYELHELSLVDNPANQFANIFSIEKVNGQTTIDGYLAKTEIENVFWDSENDIVLLSEADSALSPSSGKEMQNIGFVEKTDSENSDIVKFLVDSAKGINTIEINKEVSPMTDTTNEAVEVAAETVAEEAVVEETQVAPEADAPVEATEGSVEKSYDEDMDSKDKKKMDEDEMNKSKDMMDEDEDEMSKAKDKKSYDMEEDEMSKAKSAMPEDEDKTEVAKSNDVVESAVADLTATVTKAFSDLSEIVKAQAAQISELSKSIESVKNDVTANKDVFNEFGKRVDAVVADTAFRKSGDVGYIVQEPEVKVQKSLWGGRFLTNNDLF
jgi:hypothetical protein